MPPRDCYPELSAEDHAKLCRDIRKLLESKGAMATFAIVHHFAVAKPAWHVPTPVVQLALEEMASDGRVTKRVDARGVEVWAAKKGKP